MKERELREAALCAGCGKNIGASGIPLFYRVTIERFGLDFKACQRQQGLGLMLGGHGGLAMIMGPDEDLAVPMMDPVKVTICELCSHHGLVLPALAEEAQEKKTDEVDG